MKTYKDRLVTLVDLDEMPKQVQAVYTTSISDAVYWVAKGKPVTTAGSNGAINAYVDRKGMIRVEFMQCCITMDSRTLSTLKELRAWLKEYWPKLGVASSKSKG